MRRPVALFLALLAAAAQADTSALQSQLGLAEPRNGRWCLATGAGQLAAGATLLLYEPYQAIEASARVVGPAGEECGELKSRFVWPRSPDAPAHFYRLSPENAASAKTLAAAGVLFALLDSSARPVEGGVDLDGDGRPERLSICASGQGLHFLVESGQKVRWHAYYHLGLEVVPDCTDRIFAE